MPNCLRAGPIDILVNNAGAAESAPFVKTSDAMLERMLSVNLRFGVSLLPRRAARECSRAVMAASSMFRASPDCVAIPT